MADIQAPIVYDELALMIIDQLLADASFSYKNWSDDHVEGLRKKIRDHYRESQLGICAYCRDAVSIVSSANCHVEHVAPKSRYRDFMFEPKNLCVICADCNEIKRNQEVMQEVPDTVVRGATRKRYPRSSNAFKIVHPHFDSFAHHIEKINGLFFDKTPKGHFTIGACNLNRRLRKFGWEKAYDDAVVSEAAQRFLDTQDPLARAAALGALKKMLILMP